MYIVTIKEESNVYETNMYLYAKQQKSACKNVYISTNIKDKDNTWLIKIVNVEQLNFLNIEK